jgi:hypoxanthine phosphoribosyltransferase
MGDLASKFSKEDFIPVSWEQYGKTLQILLEKTEEYIRQHNLTVDAVIPILRGAAVPGAFLAYRLNVLRIIPVQYKYFFVDGKTQLRLLLSIPQDVDLGENPTLLLVESNHCFGITAQTAAKDIKTDLPNCTLLYAADHIDYTYQKIDYVDATFYGRLTNETRSLNEEQASELGIETNKSYLLPWEDLNEEWSTVQGEQFAYQDSQAALKDSEFKVEPNYEELMK